MMYALIIVYANLLADDSIKFKHIYRDLDTCLERKEQMVKQGWDAHCFRLEEPASTVKDLAPSTTK